MDDRARPLTGVTDDELAIIIEGTRGDWPGGARTLTPRDPCSEPNGQSFWFGADLDPDGSQVWFRVASGAVRRMQQETPGARGGCLIDALLAWMKPYRQLGPSINRFQAVVADDGDIWIERLRW